MSRREITQNPETSRSRSTSKPPGIELGFGQPDCPQGQTFSQLFKTRHPTTGRVKCCQDKEAQSVRLRAVIPAFRASIVCSRSRRNAPGDLDDGVSGHYPSPVDLRKVAGGLTALRPKRDWPNRGQGRVAAACPPTAHPFMRRGRFRIAGRRAQGMFRTPTGPTILASTSRARPGRRSHIG